MSGSSLKLKSLDDSICSVMVRQVDGSIVFWNRAAEKQYGWSRTQAVGSISHRLLGTVFPCPLEQINDELLSRGVWEGELIHSLSDGSRVKVSSRWILQHDEDKVAGDEKKPTAVVEFNNAVRVLAPESSFLKPHLSYVRWPQLHRFWNFCISNWIWWVVPVVIAMGLIGILFEFAHDLPLTPINH